MPATITLTPDEVAAITRRRRADGQRRELQALGIPFRPRRDGSPAVLRNVAELVLGGMMAGATISDNEPEVLP